MHPVRSRPALRGGTAALLATALLAGCGGGGGGNAGDDMTPAGNAGAGATPRPNPQPPTITAQALEQAAASYRENPGFQIQPGLAVINAAQAYARLELEGRGQPGAGVTIGMMDSPVDFGNDAFTPGVHELRELDFPFETNPNPEHGTSVASTLAAVRDWEIPTRDGLRRGAHGIAYAARLHAFALDLGRAVPTRDYQPSSLSGSDANFASYFARALDDADDPAAGFDILNLSFGTQGIIEDYSAADLRASVPQTLAALAQANRRRKTLLVWAAGNANGWRCRRSAAGPLCTAGRLGRLDARSPEVLPGLMALIPELRPHSVAVVAVDSGSGAIAGYSNRCGTARQWCLAAPGDVYNVAYSGLDQFGDPETGLIRDATGTSYAAPMVTGGLALMQQYFRSQLSSEQLLARMLATADRSGRYADAAIYGQGLLDLGAAVSPVGSSSLATGARVGGPGADLRFTRLQAGAALGDGLARSLAGREAVAFDELGAPFWHDLGAFAPRAEAPDAGALLRDFLADDRSAAKRRSGPALPLPGGRSVRTGMELLQPATAAPGNHLALAGRAVSFSAAPQDGWSARFFTTADDAAAPARGAVLAWRPRQRGQDGPSLRAGWLSERETLLGSRAEGAFGALRGDLLFGGAGGSLRAGAWTLTADAELGVAAPEADGGLIEEIPRMVTSAFRLHAERPAAGGAAWRLALAQPLRVERGEARLSAPVGRTPEGDVLRQRLAAELEPSGRQLDLSARWRRSLAGGDLRLGAVWTRHPGHRADASSEWALLAGWRAGF